MSGTRFSYGKRTFKGRVQENGVIRWRPTLWTRLKRLFRRNPNP